MRQVLILTMNLFIGLFVGSPLSAQADSGPLNAGLQQLAAEFFEWRRARQPTGGDEFNVLERPPGWVPDLSPGRLATDRVQYRDFLQRLDSLDRSPFGRADQVDAWLLGSAIKRLGWELDVLKAPYRNPWFYLDQTLGTVVDLLLQPPPFTPERVDEIILRLNAFTVTLVHAKANLSEAIQPFALMTIEALLDIEERLPVVAAGLDDAVDTAQYLALTTAAEQATTALIDYRRWLQRGVADMPTRVGIGASAYQWFLANIALAPYTPDEILQQGKQAWQRAAAWEAVEKNRNRDAPELTVFPTLEAQIAATGQYQREIRAFLESQGLVSIPGNFLSPVHQPIPAYLAPLALMREPRGMMASRSGHGGIRYIPAPATDLPFFSRIAAADPRLAIIHEELPGHYLQMALSRTHENPIRRQFFTATANEGVAFYAQELLLRAGLFDFSPRSKEAIYRLMQAGALSGEIDIRLASGELTIDEAASYLQRSLPMDRDTAARTAAFAAMQPGVAMSALVGQQQIVRFLADAAAEQGEEFSLRALHDFLLRNGNVPIALLRWELLNRDEDLLRLQDLGRNQVTVPN